MPDICFSDVDFYYDGDPTPILRELNLAIEHGEFVAVIGANGSGKTTLARHINALLRPSAGRVLTLGLDTDTTDEQTLFQIRSHAGMVFQNPNTQMVAGIVADDVAFGPENLAIERDEMIKRVQDALDAVALLPLAEADPSQLSGGQKQRVSLAGVLAMRPDILILDEPGAMLDVRGRRGIRRITRELHDQGMTVVLVTHFMEDAADADRIIILDKGSLAFSGKPAEVFCQTDRLRALGLDIPFSMLLAESLRERGLPVPETVRPTQLKELICSWY